MSKLKLDDYMILRINLYALRAIHNMQYHENIELYMSKNKEVVDFVNSLDYNKILETESTPIVNEIIECVKSQLMIYIDKEIEYENNLS